MKTAYFDTTMDRDRNEVQRAAIVDEETNTIVEQIEDYDRDRLEAEVLKKYPDIEFD